MVIDFIVAGRGKRVLVCGRENFWDSVKLTMGCFKELFQMYCEMYRTWNKGGRRKECSCIGIE